MPITLPAVITWDDRWLIGHPDIDNDHRGMVIICQRLYDAIERMEGPGGLRGLFDELIDATKQHFEREEAIFAEHGFADLEAHKQLHAGLITRVTNFAEGIIRTGSSQGIIEEMYLFLHHWLTSHILFEDSKFKAYL